MPSIDAWAGMPQPWSRGSTGLMPASPVSIAADGECVIADRRPGSQISGMLPSGGQKGQAGRGWYAPGRGAVVPASIPRHDNVDVFAALVMGRSMVWVRPGPGAGNTAPGRSFRCGSSYNFIQSSSG